MGSRRLIGTEGKSAYDSTDVAFWHYHWYAFPLLFLLDRFWDRKCDAANRDPLFPRFGP
ncbi:TraU family protein [uncultured Lamprocystis sp.]|jgi:conjugal transfer pilus assembly protein TraU|uniref:TraU family protein n=1 Tax=uncultured Lamprocystis sp. TaxID=543132 RepID=UPI0025DBB2A4|nr:TraU family protein [uncultured Lamprocystis sp.]